MLHIKMIMLHGNNIDKSQDDTQKSDVNIILLHVSIINFGCEKYVNIVLHKHIFYKIRMKLSSSSACSICWFIV